ncbi:MAG: DUF177 domain-containing protein [Flavobacteriaceae bacterium]|nr:DUF177 domain-containing protein [Flavobacteriaceae bacterium]
MKRISNIYDISFFGLKDEIHHFEYKIEKQFFEAFHYDEFLETNLLVNLEFNKKSTFFELNFSVKGVVNVACDVTNEPFDLPVQGKLEIVVKFGEDFNSDNEEVLIIPHNEHHINIAQFIYEMIVLAVPKKKVHPGIEDGTLHSDILKKLEELQPKMNIKEIDPRWEGLKKLLTDKNT